jgi:hypothetical protein
MKTPYNKVMYIAFILLGFYYAIVSKDYTQAPATMCIGFIFDPFDAEQK